jgi:MFS family permease
VCYLSAAGARVYDPTNLWLFAGCLIAVGFTNDLMLATAWATAQDIGRRYSAVVSGAMNMIGNLGAALGNLVTGLILAAHTDDETKKVLTSGYLTCFVLFAAVYGLGVVSWLFIDPTKPVPLPEDADGGAPHAGAADNSGG